MLNKKHIQFVDAFMQLGNGSAAYKQVYGNTTSDEAAGTSASRLLKKAEIIAEISKRQQVLRQTSALSKQDLINDLVDIKNAQKNSFPPSALKAIEILNKMMGWNEAEKIEVKQDVNLQIPGVTEEPEVDNEGEDE